MDTQPAPRSRRLRFSLRTVLILMFVAGIGFAYFAPRLKRARQQGAAVQALSEANLPITITYDYQQVGADGMVPSEASGPVWVRNWLGDDFFHPVVSVRWGGGPASYPLARRGSLVLRRGAVGPAPTLQQLGHLSALGELRELSITANVTDEGLVPIGSLGRLERLQLTRGYYPRGRGGGGGTYGDDGVAHLARLTRLKELTLRGGAITGATLGQLESLPNLESLSLAWTGLNDAGLSHLSDAASLRELILQHTAITDDGLRHLQTLKQLQTLDLSNTAVSDDGLALLRPLENMQVLKLFATSTTDVGLSHLHESKNLTEINARHTGVSTTGMVLCEQALPGCRITPLDVWRDTIRHLSEQGIDGRVRLFRTLFKTEQLPALTLMPEVRELCIDRIRIDDAALAAVGSLPNLQQLVLWHSPLLAQLEAWQVPEAGDDLSALADCPRLTGVALTGDYTAAAVASLVHVPQLRRFVYAPTAEDDLSEQHVQAVLNVLPGLVQLDAVFLGGPMIDAGDIERLGNAMPTARVEALPSEVNIRDIRAVLAGREHSDEE